MQYKVVIVDDEPPICDEIEYLLKKHPNYKTEKKFNQCFDALAYIIEFKPDILFLDIKMPGISGLEMARKLNELAKPPLIVFITAFQEHALEAFDTPAIGYITKPVTEENLANTLQKIDSLLVRYHPQQANHSKKICVIDNGRILPLDKQDIILAYVSERDVYIRTSQQQYTCNLTFKEVEAIISDEPFLRIHRQYIVNLDYIAEIVPWFHGSYMLRMKGSEQQENIPVSRTKVKLLKQLMGLK
jgi:DNA-binding LytR/AlgR family response regulator